MDFEDAPIADLVAEDGVRDFGLHAAFIGGHDRAATGIGEGYRSRAGDEVVGLDFSVVDKRKDRRVGDQRAELLGQVERECGLAVTRLV